MTSFRPRTWTHHHTNRLLHASLFATFAFLSAFVGIGLLATWGHIKADQAPQVPLSVATSATVPEISESSSTPAAGGLVWPGFPTTTPVSAAPRAIRQGTVTLYAEPGISQEKKVRNDKKELVSVFVFSVNQPIFYGETNIPNATLFLNVFGGPSAFRSTFIAGSDGKWMWKSPEALKPGSYAIRVTASDPLGEFKPAEATLAFVIPPGAVLPPPVIPVKPSGEVFDVFVQVSPHSKVVYPGQEVVVATQLTGFGTPDKAEKVSVNFVVVNPSGDQVLSTVEVVEVRGTGIFLKSFYPHPDGPAGPYRVIVRVHKQGELASSYDTFEVKGRGIVPVGAGTLVDVTLLFQILLVLFLLFTIIAYFEYNKVSVLSRYIRKVSEEDLEKER